MPDAGWKLVWSEEFDYQGPPDPAKWVCEEGFIRNREMQYYTGARPENVRVDGRRLVIESRREKWPNAAHDADASDDDWKRARPEAHYTSASIKTMGKAAWQHARVEVRAQIPTGRGMWPAIWMLGEDMAKRGWPACGEIDVMENVGYDPETIQATIHTAKYNHKVGNFKSGTIHAPDAFSTFHVYAVEWNAQRMDFFFDDTCYFTYENEGTGPDAWPYDQPFYLTINAAVGGNWGGREGIDDSIFPQKYLVDFVRVYQKD